MGIYLLPVYAYPQTTSTKKDYISIISIKGNSLLVALKRHFLYNTSKIKGIHMQILKCNVFRLYPN